jgi:hypothetical protein
MDTSRVSLIRLTRRTRLSHPTHRLRLLRWRCPSAVSICVYHAVVYNIVLHATYVLPCAVEYEPAKNRLDPHSFIPNTLLRPDPETLIESGGAFPFARTICSDDCLLLDSSHPHRWYCFGLGVGKVARPRGIRCGAHDL